MLKEDKRGGILGIIIVVLLIVAIALIAGGYFLLKGGAGINPPIKMKIDEPIEENLATNEESSSELLEIKPEGTVDWDNAYIMINKENIVEENTFTPGNTYTVYITGVTGFEEYGEEGLVDINLIGLATNENNAVFLNETYTAYETPAEYAEKSLSFSYILPEGMQSGKYTWNFIVSDERNKSNKITAIINFEIQ